MTSPASTASPSIQLPKALAIGFTGHRTLVDESRCREWILNFLSQQKASAPGPVYGIASVASGADLLFSEGCLQLELPLRVLLPLPLEEFQKDFDQATWLRADRVLKKAASVEVVGSNQSREESYYECGIETVLQSGLLLALWNGDHSRGLGGTADIVSFARGLGRPVVWLHSVTGEKRTFHDEAAERLLTDPELAFLNGIPGPAVPPEVPNPEDLARAWFDKIDSRATRLAPQFRKLAAVPIVCTAAAALFTGAGAWTHNVGTWLAIGAGLGISAAVLPAVLRLNRRQSDWARTRTAAEVCRSVLAFWSAPVPYEAVGPEMIPELSGVLMSLNFLKMLDRSRSQVPLEQFKSQYRQERLSGQIDYFSNHAALSAQSAHRYRFVMWSSVALALVINLWLFAAAHSMMHAATGLWRQWLALSASVAFQIATVAAALLAVNDCDRRRQRYRQLQERLTQWDAQLAALRTWSGVLRVAGRIERAIVAELIEWRSLIQNHKLSRK